ncbi:hypothetical protein ACFLVZ_00970 [Chloroflexota bacterium]
MYEWENIDFIEAGGIVEVRDPRQFGWGYYSKDTSNSPGVGAFSWFESLDELLNYLVNIEPNIWSYGVNGVDEETYTKLKTKIQEILNKDDLKKGLTNKLREKISTELKEGEICWWGEFSDLYTGNDSFSRQLIGGYLGDDEEPENNESKVVTEEQIPEFLEFCRGFGH